MRNCKFSTNKICVILGSFFLFASIILMSFIYYLTGNTTVVLLLLCYMIVVFWGAILFIVLIRKQLIKFSDELCRLLDDMISNKNNLKNEIEEESLFYKINHRLIRLYEVMQESRKKVEKERSELQELISDISHQVKTPVTNLKLVNTTLLQQEMSEEKRRSFLNANAAQLDKLDFLMQAMVKTSRLETGVISLKKKMQPIYNTLADALGGIVLNAEKKSIKVQVSCSEKIIVNHDPKWTREALFNILDNAVKYTLIGGEINVCVKNLEFYTRIDIKDTGKGIPEALHATIFKRFYREDNVHDIEGIGIGLYLTREIITMQGGYVKVSSEVGKGSTFSVFLPCR